ncbi:MAG: 3-demethylubiquinone-9 3-O-methyltransferase [Bacteriovoracaceae bacterium]|nr:3-demethylubiquinone-9 3-O-methyltransferase [Bacteriovoracaceae bacterium]
MTSDQINNDIYNTYKDRWYLDNDGELGVLRREGEIKTELIYKALRKENISTGSVLDIGCGGGWLCNDLAKNGFKAFGVDTSKSSLETAKKYDETNSVEYICSDAHKIPLEDNSIDVIFIMDFLEHVEDPLSILRESSRILKSEGLLFYNTFNRNFLSWIVAVKGVEWFSGVENIHLYKLFIKPNELKAYLTECHLDTVEMYGLRPKVNLDAFKSLIRRKVHPNFKFKVTKSLATGYMGYAKKSNVLIEAEVIKSSNS